MPDHEWILAALKSYAPANVRRICTEIVAGRMLDDGETTTADCLTAC